MNLNPLDITVFLLFIGFVTAFSMFKSRFERTEEDYFLASRGLVWWLIGFSLIAANISTEQFVGMNGSAAGNVGMAIASYDWMAAASMVLVALSALGMPISQMVKNIISRARIIWAREPEKIIQNLLPGDTPLYDREKSSGGTSSSGFMPSIFT